MANTLMELAQFYEQCVAMLKYPCPHPPFKVAIIILKNNN